MKYFKFKKNIGKEIKKSSIHESSIWDCIHWILSKLIPKANPDFEKKYKNIDTWYIEYDDEKHFTTKEIGIDKDGNVIVKAPFYNNFGLWVDSDMKYEDYLSYDICVITKNDFNLLWNLPIIDLDTGM